MTICLAFKKSVHEADIIKLHFRCPELHVEVSFFFKYYKTPQGTFTFWTPTWNFKPELYCHQFIAWETQASSNKTLGVNIIPFFTSLSSFSFVSSKLLQRTKTVQTTREIPCFFFLNVDTFLKVMLLLQPLKTNIVICVVDTFSSWL